MAGVFAALAAAGDGASVVLIEPSNVLGGQGTAGGVAGFCGDTQRVNDPFRRLVEQLSAHDKIAPYNPRSDRRAYDLEICGFFLQEMVAKADVDILLHARVLDAVADAGRVSDVLVSCGSEVIEFHPTVAIDATGDCVIAHRAGFPTVHEGANVQLPMSLYFTLWDTGKPVTSFLPPGCPTWDTDDDLPMTTLHVFDSGKVEIKMKVVGFDAANGESLSQAEIHARRQMMGLIYHLQTKGYGGRVLDSHELAAVSRQIGQREGRRIVGEVVLTEEDVTHAASFEDAVAVGTYHLDYHWPDKVRRAGTGITTMVEPYHIPLRSLIPKGARNLLAVGRSASGDQMAMSSFRVQATCAQMGFAAGTVAAVCKAQGADLTTVDVSQVQRAIEAGGQSLDLSDYGDYLRHQIQSHEHIFEKTDDFASCHASSLVLLSNGGFLVVWFGGTQEGRADVGIWASERRGCVWLPPRLLARVRDVAHWNPVLLGAGRGNVHLFFKVSVEGTGRDGRFGVSEGWETWWMSSVDDGVSWSEPRILVEGDTQGRGPVKDKPIVLASGAWLAGASTETPEVWEVFFDRSEDEGLTWEQSTTVAMDPSVFTGKGAIQPTVWESEPGRVHALVRTTAGFVGRTDSTDDGRTWSELTLTDLSNNNSGLDAARLTDGRIALVCNPIDSGRTPLSVLISDDNGTTWTRRLDLETAAGEYSYPAIIPTAGGMAISYTWNRERIAFWRGSVEAIPKIGAS
jgi:predicted neuraminidase